MDEYGKEDSDVKFQDSKVYRYMDEGSTAEVESHVDLDEDDNTILEPTNVESKLTLFTVLIYGCGEVGVSVGNTLYGFFFTSFMLEVTLLEPSKVGTVLLVGQIWDAITTPIIGYLTDNIHTRWGRRKPWLVFSAIPFGLSLFALWQAWPDEASNTKFAYYLLVVLLFNFFGNCIQIPYAALTADLVECYDDANILTRARMAIDMIGGLASLLTSRLISSYHFPNGRINYAYGYFVLSLIWGIISIIPPCLVAIFIKEKPVVNVKPLAEEVDQDAPSHTPTSHFKSLWSALKTVASTVIFKPYLILTIMYLLSWTMIQFSQSNLYLFYKYVLEIEYHFQWVIFLIQGLAAASLFFWSYICNFLSKNKVFMIGIGIIAISNIPGYWATKNWGLWAIYFMNILPGIGISTAYLIPWSMVPDIINADEYFQKTRREGVFYSIFVLIQKIGIALALSLHSYGLGWAGFTTIGDQPESVIKIIRLMGTWIPFSVFLVSIFLAWFYPLGKKKMAYILSQLQIRHQAASG